MKLSLCTSASFEAQWCAQRRVNNSTATVPCFWEPAALLVKFVLYYMQAESYQPHSITLNWGRGTLSQGAQIQSRHHLSPQRKLQPPKLKYEVIEVSEVRWTFERKVLMHYSYFESLWKQGHYTLQLLLGAFESKVLWTLQLQRGAIGKCLACLPLNTPLYITLTMILYENMKPIEHVLLHPICVLSHLMCACKHCIVKLSLYYWTH